MENKDSSAHVKQLLRKYLAGECNPVEEQQIARWYLSFGREDAPELSDAERKKITSKIKKSVFRSLEDKRKAPLRRLRTTRIIQVAAAIVVFLGIAVTLSQLDLSGSGSLSNQPIARAVNDIELSNDSLPALQFPDGRLQYLESRNHPPDSSSGIQVIKDGDGSFYYKVQVYDEGIPESLTNRNLIFRTAKGYRNKVLLNDGTIVWLNSESSLEYPSSFHDDVRSVKLVGEAFFEVAYSAAKPFVVESEGTRIKVLGTSFNISAYPDDASMVTTLIEGSIEFQNNRNSIKMEPGDQILLSKETDQLQKRTVDGADYTSWKDGYFTFNNLTVLEVINKVKHWYTIEKVFVENEHSGRITGTFKQSKSLRELLDRLEDVSGSAISIEGRRVMIK